MEHVVIKNAETGVTFCDWPWHQNLVSDLQLEDCEIGVRNVDPASSFGGISATECAVGFSTVGGYVEFEDITATDCGTGFYHSTNPVSVTGATFVECDTAVVSWGGVTLRDADIQDCQAYGVWARGGDFRMAHTTVEDKTGLPTPVAVKVDSTVATAVLDTCRISGAGTGVETKAQTTLTGCDISDCYTGLSAPWYPTVNLVGSHVVGELAAVSVKSALLVGDTLSSLWTGLFSDGTATCRETRFVDCGVWGIYASGTGADVTLRECAVSGSDVGVYFGTGSSGDIDSACVFTGNDTGVEIYGTDEVTIRASTFEENTTNGIYVHSADAAIEGNTITGSTNGIYLYESDGAVTDGNVIEDNASGIKCDEGSAPLVRENKIASNEVGIAALDDADPDVGHACLPVCDETCMDEGRNNISENTTHHIANLSSSVTISAECNWWGPRGPLPSKFSGAVDYTPYLPENPVPELAAGQWEGPANPPEGETRPEGKSEIPIAFDLSQNYPNPFNPTTTIRYQIPRPGGAVSIVIYDVRGSAVRTLVNENKVPGYYNLAWDGRNDNGVGVATGVYFIRMSAPGFVQTEKLMVLK
jgi:parallel beta-helix repeat protein